MNLTNYPEPTGTLINKKRGSTNFKQCGWCDYASGTHRYDYCIEGKCSLLRSYSKDVHWDDKCNFITASKSELTELIKYHNCEIQNLKVQISMYKEYISILKNLETDANYKPTLPRDREYNYFNIGDKVAVFVERKWHFGEVTDGHTYHDGIVSYVLEDIGSGGLGVSRPEILLKEEYEWFKRYPEEYEIWCKKAYEGIKQSPAPIE
jgi:hypothetical protein